MDTPGYGVHSSLTLDAGDNLHIGYQDALLGDLKYAWLGRVNNVPATGGMLDYGAAQFTFSNGVFADTVIVNYHTVEPSVSQPHTGFFFNITVVYSSTGQSAQVVSGQTYTVVVHYNEADIPAGMDESDLMLHY